MDRPLGSRYVLHDLLGRGAMGEVYRGTVRGSEAAVAVKLLKPELVSDPETVARFFQERSILTAIDHPNVVRVVDLVAEGDILAIVMELVQGQDLRRLLRARRTLPPAEAVRLVCQLLDGLAAVHAAGIVHRDVKPENMLLDGAAVPRVRLTDFGVARLSYGASLTKISSIIGTPEYMAPEVADHDSAAPSADLYSAGIVLYEMLAGRTPFAGGHPLAVLRRHVEQPPPPIPGIPAPLWAQLKALLAKEPGHRPPSATQAGASLARLAASLENLPPLPLLTEPPPGTWAPGTSVSRTSAPDLWAPSTSVRDLWAPSTSAPDPGAAGPSAPRTIVRHRPYDEVSFTGSAAPAVSATGLTRPARSRWRSRPAVIALPASLVILAAAAAGVILTRSHQPAAQAAPVADQTASYTFAPQQYKDGLLIVRHWVLGGKGGSVLTETVTASSATGKAVQAPFDEPIPKGIAPTLGAVRFTPAPDKIVQSDPVVAWNLNLPAQGSVTVGYTAQVPATGAAKARLLAWASALASLQHSLNLGAGTVQLRSLTMNVPTLQLDVAATAQLTVSGVLGNGTAAPRDIVTAAAWNSANPSVAVVGPNGEVTGTGPGTTVVTAQIGAVQAYAAVTVTGSQPALADGGTPKTIISGKSPGKAAPTSPGKATPASHATAPSPAADAAPGTATGSSPVAVLPPVSSSSTTTPPAPPPSTTSPPPPPSTTSPPAAPASYPYAVYHTCANGACGLNLRSGPGYSSYPVTRVLLDGDAVNIVCQTTGQSVSGKDGSSSNVWDKTVQGDYAADFYIDTPGMTGSFSPPIPRC